MFEFIITREKGVVILKTPEDNVIVQIITEEQLVYLVDMCACTEEELIQLLVAIKWQYQNSNWIDESKRLSDLEWEDIKECLPILLERFSFDFILHCFSNMKYMDIRDVFCSENPCMVLEQKV